jgi:hypothetical protein
VAPPLRRARDRWATTSLAPAAHERPKATSGEVIGKTIHLRTTYHFGPRKISMYLKR